MDIEKARQLLTGAGFEFKEEPLANGHGIQLFVPQGANATIYNSGRCVLGGKRPDLIKALFEGDDGFAKPQPAKSVAPEASRKVFVVYGHDERARNDLEAMLRRWKLEPLILDQLPSGGQTIIEKLESVRAEANFAVVLATPDDEGHRAGHPDEKLLRARQNVVMELGMMLAILGRSRVAVLTPNISEMERPSDIQGLIYYSYKDSVHDVAVPLAKELNGFGIRIDLDRL